MSRQKWLVLGLILALVGLYFGFDLNHYFDLDYLKSKQAGITQFYSQHPWWSAFLYFSMYIVITAFSLPGAALLTLAAGAVFGLALGVALVSFASTIGATLAFLVARYLLRELVQQRFSARLRTINAGMEREGALYLLTLRLVPIFPFFMINLLMGLTRLRTSTYYWVSQLGMFPATVVYVNAGTQLGQIETLRGILSPGVIGSFVLLGVFPWVARWLIQFIKNYSRSREFEKPKQFDANVVVIGAGAAGLVAAYISAAVKAKVVLIEKHKMGGECLNIGCVPSKALIQSAKFVAQINRAKAYGMKSASVDFEFAHIMERVQRVIKKIEPHDSIERYTQLGVECVQGEAQIISPYVVEVAGRRITTKNIIVATGGRAAVPAIPGLEASGYLTADTVWDLRTLPARLVVLGGGPIGCELAQCFARLGSEVSIVQRRDCLLPREDSEFSQLLARRFRQEGIRLCLAHEVTQVSSKDGVNQLVCEHAGKVVNLPFDQLLIAVGREPNIQGFGLQTLPITTNAHGGIEVNDYLQTNYPNIYACGDVVGPFQFTHAAAHQAWYCAVNALFGRFRKYRVDYSAMPWATFTQPEIARVGLNEQQAREQGVDYEVTRYGIDDLDRAIADETDYGLVKVLTKPGKDKILGVTVAGEHAGDTIIEYITAMRYGLGMNKILSTIHIYPTLVEANKYAAGQWRRAHTPQRLLRWVERYHRWMRNS